MYLLILKYQLILIAFIAKVFFLASQGSSDTAMKQWPPPQPPQYRDHTELPPRLVAARAAQKQDGENAEARVTSPGTQQPLSPRLPGDGARVAADRQGLLSPSASTAPPGGGGVASGEGQALVASKPQESGITDSARHEQDNDVVITGVTSAEGDKRKDNITVQGDTPQVSHVSRPGNDFYAPRNPAVIEFGSLTDSPQIQRRKHSQPSQPGAATDGATGPVKKPMFFYGMDMNVINSNKGRSSSSTSIINSNNISFLVLQE